MAVLGVGAGTMVTSQMDADFYAGITGGEKMVLPIGRQMESELIDNNTVRIHDGVAIIQGRYIYVEANTYDEFKIENGAQGVNRYDIIGYRLYREDGKEFCENVVTKDAGVAGTVETEVFRDGGQEVFIPMYRVYLDGLNIKSVEPLFETLYTNEMIKTILGKMSTNERIIANYISSELVNRAHDLEEFALTVVKEQVKEYTDLLNIPDSNEYFKIKSQKAFVNTRTGEVSVYMSGTMKQTVAAGKNFALAILNKRELVLTDDIVVPVTVAPNLNNIGSLKCAFYSKDHSSYSNQIRGIAMNQITKDSLVHVHFKYYVNARNLRTELGIVELELPNLGELSILNSGVSGTLSPMV